jgi:hypothetical protein
LNAVSGFDAILGTRRGGTQHNLLGTNACLEVERLRTALANDDITEVLTVLRRYRTQLRDPKLSAPVGALAAHVCARENALRTQLTREALTFSGIAAADSAAHIISWDFNHRLLHVWPRGHLTAVDSQPLASEYTLCNRDLGSQGGDWIRAARGEYAAVNAGEDFETASCFGRARVCGICHRQALAYASLPDFEERTQHRFFSAARTHSASARELAGAYTTIIAGVTAEISELQLLTNLRGRWRSDLALDLAEFACEDGEWTLRNLISSQRDHSELSALTLTSPLTLRDYQQAFAATLPPADKPKLWLIRDHGIWPSRPLLCKDKRTHALAAHLAGAAHTKTDERNFVRAN